MYVAMNIKTYLNINNITLLLIYIYIRQSIGIAVK